MRYVIQSYSKPSSYIIVTPRLKIFFILKNIKYFLLLFKFKTSFLKQTDKISILSFFFFKGIFLFFINSNKNLSGSLTNKITQTALYWNFKCLNRFLIDNKVLTKNLHLPMLLKTYLFNYYYFSIKFSNFRLLNLFHKKLFYIYTFIANMWYQQQQALVFVLNFFFQKNNLKLFRWNSGYFFKIRNV